jgi:hypothetical protein
MRKDQRLSNRISTDNIDGVTTLAEFIKGRAFQKRGRFLLTVMNGA